MTYSMSHNLKWGFQESKSDFFLFILAHAGAQQVEEYPEMEMALTLGVPPRSIWKAWVAGDELGK